MRKIKILTFTVSDIKNIEEKVNEVLKQIQFNKNKVINIEIEKIGMNPTMLIYNIIYDNEVKNDINKYIKIFKYTFSDFKKETVEKEINKNLIELEHTFNIINIKSYTFGLSPINYIYNIIYQEKTKER